MFNCKGNVVEIGEIEALPRCFGFAAFQNFDEASKALSSHMVVVE